MHVTCLHENADVTIRDACDALNLPRASYYRAIRETDVCDLAPPKPRTRPVRALSDKQRAEVLDALNSERFVDCAPRQVYGELLDEGRYYCSVRTMYRVLENEDQVKARRQAARAPVPAPQLEARAPGEVWSWDITKLRGPKGIFFHLYVIIDIFSRYVVGWTVARRECKHLAAEFIEATCEKERVQPDTLVLHADRGSAMRSGTVAELLDDLGVARSHSRPRVSDDNPFSEAQFKTLKYVPDFPDRFIDDDDVSAFLRRFFHWYNEEHRHSGLALLTPADVHHDRVDEVLAARDDVLRQAYAAHPERFVNGPPKARRPPQLARIGPAGESSNPAPTP